MPDVGSYATLAEPSDAVRTLATVVVTMSADVVSQRAISCTSATNAASRVASGIEGTPSAIWTAAAIGHVIGPETLADDADEHVADRSHHQALTPVVRGAGRSRDSLDHPRVTPLSPPGNSASGSMKGAAGSSGIAATPIQRPDPKSAAASP